MALTELQMPTKVNFYSKLQNVATRVDNTMRELENVAEFIGMVDAADLDAMGVPTGSVRSDLANLRTALDELVAFYRGESVTSTNSPAIVMDKIRAM